MPTQPQTPRITISQPQPASEPVLVDDIIRLMHPAQSTQATQYTLHTGQTAPHSQLVPQSPVAPAPTGPPPTHTTPVHNHHNQRPLYHHQPTWHHHRHHRSHHTSRRRRYQQVRRRSRSPSISSSSGLPGRHHRPSAPWQKAIRIPTTTPPPPPTQSHNSYTIPDDHSTKFATPLTKPRCKGKLPHRNGSQNEILLPKSSRLDKIDKHHGPRTNGQTDGHPRPSSHPTLRSDNQTTRG